MNSVVVRLEKTCLTGADLFRKQIPSGFRSRTEHQASKERLVNQQLP
jgi:hypothetical protein